MKLKKLILIYPFLMMMISGQTNHYISGYITDPSSKPLYGANVVLTNTYSGSTTDSLGFQRVLSKSFRAQFGQMKSLARCTSVYLTHSTLFCI